MKNIIALILCALAFELDAQISQRDYRDAFNLIDGWLDAQKDYEHLPGISVAVARDQEIVWSSGFGYSNPATKNPASSSTIYSICSISKLFTAIAVMQLVEEGKLRLDDEISSVLPNFDLRQKFSNSAPITVRSILTHSSGLPRESDIPYWAENELFPSVEQIQMKWSEQETLYPASTYFQYSNLGLSILGMVVEKISGKPYRVYVEENILLPLKLNATRPYFPKDLWGQQMAVGYTTLSREGKREALAPFDTRGMTPAAGFTSTVEDLAKFASWNFRLYDKMDKEILLPSSLKDMQRVHWVEPDWSKFWGSTFGLGFRVWNENNQSIVGHDGWCPGYRSALHMNPKDKIAVSVMINAVGTDPEFYAQEIREIMATVDDQSVVSSSPELHLYAGLYSDSEFFQVLVTPWYGDLAILELPSWNPDSDMIRIRQVEGNSFRRVRSDKTLGEEVKFELDSSGQVFRLWRHSNYSTRIK